MSRLSRDNRETTISPLQSSRFQIKLESTFGSLLIVTAKALCLQDRQHLIVKNDVLSNKMPRCSEQNVYCKLAAENNSKRPMQEQPARHCLPHQ